MPWRLTMTGPAEKDLVRLAVRDRNAVQHKLDQLANDPFDTDIRKLTGVTPETWRVRAGDYRILVDLDHAAQIVTVHHVRHRREAYR